MTDTEINCPSCHRHMIRKAFLNPIGECWHCDYCGTLVLRGEKQIMKMTPELTIKWLQE